NRFAERHRWFGQPSTHVQVSTSSGRPGCRRFWYGQPMVSPIAPACERRQSGDSVVHTSRRNWLACALPILRRTGHSVSAGEAGPSILFILAGDLGWSDLGCYGHPWHETPHIDQLADEGMRFTRAYASAPICSASRASLLTGKTPARLGFEFVTKDAPGRQ